jgi:glycosyltransferase involved in cell wall biosynthesis
MPTGVLKVITVHDLAWLFYPETIAHYTLLAQRLFAGKAIQYADKIITVSRSTGDDLIRVLGVPASRIHLVYPGISENYRPRDPAQAAEYISRKYDIAAHYMAVVGTVEPRKNLALLVDVLRILKGRRELHCPLVVAGADGWKSSLLFRKIQSAGLTEEEIRFLGYLPDEDMPSLYAGARLFLFPSLYEGFGFPPLEAMACGTPVIASNARCMPEVLGDGAILLDPMDAGGFALWAARLLSDENLRRSLSAAGIQQAQKFRWERCAKETLRTFEGTCERYD